MLKPPPGFPLSVNSLGSPCDTGSKDCVLSSSFGTNPGKEVKAVVISKQRKHLALPQRMGQSRHSYSTLELGLELLLLCTRPILRKISPDSLPKGALLGIQGACSAFILTSSF